MRPWHPFWPVLLPPPSCPSLCSACWRSREILRQPRWARRDTPAKDAAEATVSVFYDWFTRHSKSDGCNAHLMSCTLPALDATGA
mmetsp:Transcript_17371/g.35796  ORF Transcript_17371/g.35796 Transcript_17371/m.35796 type:complete len:85 (-) Transcript_17371:7-261(-)